MNEPKPVMTQVDNTNATLSVAEFCARYQLDNAEESRLRKLFGDYASRHELIINVQRKPNTR